MICFWVRLKRALNGETGTKTPTAFKPPSAKIEDERRKKRGGGRGGGGQKARRSESHAARLSSHPLIVGPHLHPHPRLVFRLND